MCREHLNQTKFDFQTRSRIFIPHILTGIQVSDDHENVALASVRVVKLLFSEISSMAFRNL